MQARSVTLIDFHYQLFHTTFTSQHHWALQLTSSNACAFQRVAHGGHDILSLYRVARLGHGEGSVDCGRVVLVDAWQVAQF
jgi:hypothetical protein